MQYLRMRMLWLCLQNNLPNSTANQIYKTQVESNCTYSKLLGLFLQVKQNQPEVHSCLVKTAPPNDYDISGIKQKKTHFNNVITIQEMYSINHILELSEVEKSRFYCIGILKQTGQQ